MKLRYTIQLMGLTGLLAMGSCKKYLTETPNNALPFSAAIVDASTATAAVTGAYDAVQGYYASDFPTLGTITADNVVFNGTLSEYLQLDQNAIPTDNVITVSAYRGIYRAINSANNVIAAVPGVKDVQLSDSVKNVLIGEAYFIRALGYFDLARGWGGVQLQLTPTTTVDALKGVKRSTLAQTYDQVLADLKKAEELLPENGIVRNRARKSTARALRARLHLYRGEWQEAITYATQVIGNPQYELVKPYKTFFTAPFLSKESVFELTFSPSDRNGFWSSWYPSSSGGSFTLKPSATFVAQVSEGGKGGARKSLIAGSGNTTYGVLYNTVGVSNDPSYVIRIAELYLIRAEARAQTNDLSGALSDLDAVRNRADAGGSSATTKAEILSAIEAENSIEFAFEAHRWFDLVRTGRAGDVLGVKDTRFWLFPLPYSDVLSDPDLEGKNNPGYN